MVELIRIRKNIYLVVAMILMAFFTGCGSGGTGDTPGAEETNANLSDLFLSNGTLTFNSDTTAYSVEVANTVTSVTVTATTNQSAATMKINGVHADSDTAFGPVNLNVGPNTIRIVVTSSDGSTTKTYSIVVTRLAQVLSNNANLSSITLSDGTLSPGFIENTTTYNVQVPHSVPSIEVTPVMAGVNALITVNGAAVDSGSASSSIALNTGSNTITILVTAEDGVTTKTYTLSVNRLPAPSNNPNLANLTLSQGTLAPIFNENTIAYTVQVPYNITTMTLTPTVSDINAAITVNGSDVDSGSPSQAVALSTGNNTITVVVTAQDGTTTKTYTIAVTKLSEPSHNANLANLSLSAGTLSPAFSGNTTAYTAQVLNTISSVTVTPTSADSHSTITVNGQAVISGTSSQNIPLTVGSNTMTVSLTAQDDTTAKSYTVVVTRLAEPSHNANLSGITLSSGTLSPGFAENTVAYNVQIPYTVPSVTVTPVMAGVNATITINGTTVVSGAASSYIALNTGSNTITILVTAEDGATTKTYTLAVNRLPAPSSNANLANLTLSQGTLSPAFNENTIAYTVQVPYTVTTMTLTPTVADSNAAQTVNGTVVGSGFPSQAVSLTTGSNTITVVVTAQDGTTQKTYTVVVTKLVEPSHNANLAGLTLSSGTLSPAFAGETTFYTSEVANTISSLTVTPTSADSHSTITVNGQAVISGISSQNIPITVGSNTITVVTTAQDGTTTKTYTVTVTRLSLSSNATLANLTLSAGSLEPSFTATGYNYTVSVHNNIASIMVTPTCAGVNATVSVNGTSVVSGTATLPISLQVGTNTITVIITAEDTVTTLTYTISVTRYAPSVWSQFHGNSMRNGLSTVNTSANNGTLKWTFTTDNKVTSSPAIGCDGTIYVGSEDGYLYAINPNGTLNWKYQTGTDIQYSSPAIESDGTICVGSFNENFAHVEGHLYGFNPSGTLRWSYAMMRPWSSPTIGPDGSIFMASHNSYSTGDCFLYAFSASGGYKWELYTGAGEYHGTMLGYTSPAISSDGSIYFSSHTYGNGSEAYNFFGINSDGTVKWRNITSENPHSYYSDSYGASIGSDGTIYLSSYSRQIYISSGRGYLRAINPDDGTEKWHFTVPQPEKNLWACPAIGPDGTIYVGSVSDLNYIGVDGSPSNNCYLYAINPNGTLKWSYPSGSNIYSSAAIGSEGTIYFGSADHTFYALNPDGTLKWQYQTDDMIVSSPAIGADGTVYVGSNDGKLYAFGH